MAYNKQANPWGVSSSELGWKGFADGARHGNPAAIAPPSSDAYTKLAMKAITDIGGAAWDEYTAPVNGGQSMWGDELGKFDTAIAAQKTPEAIEGAQMAKRNFMRSHPGAGKEIYNRPEWTEDVPDFLMPGGSRYKVPEGMINDRQAREKRANYKSPLGVNYEFPAAKTAAKPVVSPTPPATPYDKAMAKSKADAITRDQTNSALGLNKVTPNQSAWDKFNVNKDNAYLLQKKLSKAYNSTPSAPWWQIEPMMSDKNLKIENMNEGLKSWISGERGVTDPNRSEASMYFREHPEEYKDFRNNPQKFWFDKINKGNKNISKAW